MQSKEHKDKKYAWQLEHDSDYTSAIVFDSIEECIADAQDYFAEENVKIKSITIQELEPYEIFVNAEDVLEMFGIVQRQKSVILQMTGWSRQIILLTNLMIFPNV